MRSNVLERPAIPDLDRALHGPLRVVGVRRVEPPFVDNSAVEVNQPTVRTGQSTRSLAISLRVLADLNAGYGVDTDRVDRYALKGLRCRKALEQLSLQNGRLLRHGSQLGRRE